jgi:hypothetical protein
MSQQPNYFELITQSAIAQYPQQLEQGQVEAIGTALTYGTIFKDADVCPVVDQDGDPLVRDTIYLYNGHLGDLKGQRIRITRWQFGSGNLLDIWYWVWFLAPDLQEKRITIDVKYVNRNPTYTAPFAKLPQVNHPTPEAQ